MVKNLAENFRPVAPPQLIDDAYSPDQHARLLQVVRDNGPWPLIHFTKVTAVAYASKGVRLNTVVPGLMMTPIVQRLAERYNAGDFEGMVAKRNAQVPMARIGDAWDVANAALFLCSDEARYVTGTELVVDGGLTAFTGWPA